MKLPFMIGFDDPELQGGFGQSLTPLQQAYVERYEAARDQSVEVSHATFRKHVEGLNEWARQYGYAVGSEQGLHLKDDYHVCYYRTVWDGHPCYYIVWSAYEFFWCDAPLPVVAEEAA